jgi:ribosome-associated protein
VVESDLIPTPGRGLEENPVQIDDRLVIPDEELSFATSRSGGPGGQNVNKLETRVTVDLDVGASPTLTPEQKAKLQERLATRITRAGVLKVTSQRHRTQAANRQAAMERMAELISGALAEEAPRRPTRMPRAGKERRLGEKRHRSSKLRERAVRSEEE